MNTSELYQILKQDRFTGKQFLGVYASDRLPTHIDSFPTCLVGNTQPGTHPGEHWVALYFPEKGEGIYFCSYGQPANAAYKQYMDKTCNVGWSHSNKNVCMQSIRTSICGQWCIYFLHAVCAGASPGKALKALLTLCQCSDERDKVVCNFVNERYGSSKQVYSPDFLINQIATMLT